MGQLGIRYEAYKTGDLKLIRNFQNFHHNVNIDKNNCKKFSKKKTKNIGMNWHE